MPFLSQQLIDAAHGSNVELIAALKADGYSLNDIDQEGEDLLYHFIWQCCDEEKLQQILALGCLPANKNTPGGTPLIAAIWCKNPLSVRMLLDAGANPNAIGFMGDDEASALDTVIDDYCECTSKVDMENMIAIERMIRSAGGRVHGKLPNSGHFPNWNYDTNEEGEPFKSNE